MAKRSLYLITASVLLICNFAKEAQADQGVVEFEGKWYQAGDTIYGYKNYIKLVVGDAACPLLLGIPHDGVLHGEPEIPEIGRVGRDVNTKPFTFALAAAFKEDTGLQPWIMINEIHRKRVDPNTYPSNVKDRYGVDTEASKTYDSYHAILRFARTAMLNHLPDRGGLFIDMHGHGRRYANRQSKPYTSIVTGEELLSRVINQNEVSYGLAGEWLAEPDSLLNERAEWSSIAALAKAHPDVPFVELIRGPYSLGTLLEKEGAEAIPSNVNPFPEIDGELYGFTDEGEPRRRGYFTGGFLTRKYGSATKGRVWGYRGNMSAIQIESPGITVRREPEIYTRSALKFKRAIIAYLNHWYGYDFPNSAYPYEYFL